MSDILTLGYIEALIKSGRLEVSIQNEYTGYFDTPPLPTATLRFKKKDGSKVELTKQRLYRFPLGGGPY